MKSTTIKSHPAKFSDTILEAIKPYIPYEYVRILDPFAGTGKLKNIVNPNWLYLNEIQEEWAIQGKPANVTIGDTLFLPYANKTFDMLITSPAFGNRMADHHFAKDKSKRNTYTHVLGHKLHLHNSGQMQWGEQYRKFHEDAWIECYRVLKNDGFFLLNVSNHIRKGDEIFVSEWHLKFLTNCLGLKLLNHIMVETPRNRNGQHSDLRVAYENIYILNKTIVLSEKND